MPDKLLPQTIRKAICLTLARAGIKMPINRAMIAITTNSSTRVKPLFFLIVFLLTYLGFTTATVPEHIVAHVFLIDKCLFQRKRKTPKAYFFLANPLNNIPIPLKNGRLKFI
jgi:hypothetical protein